MLLFFLAPALALELDDPLHVLPTLRVEGVELQGVWRQPGGQMLSPVTAAEAPGRRFLALVEVDPASPMVLEARGVAQNGARGPWVPAAQRWVGDEARVYAADLDEVYEGVQVRITDGEAITALSYELMEPVGEPRRSPGDLTPPPATSLSDVQRAIGVIDRDTWGADPTDCTTTESDWYRMAIHHTAGGQTYGGTVQGAVQALQAYAMSGEYCDIPYQFLVGYDGTLWEGRQLIYYSGATGGDNNDGNIAVCFLGCYDSGGCGTDYDTPDDNLMVSARLLIQTLADEHDFVTDSDTMRGHRDWPDNSTACPGDLIYARLDELRAETAPFQATLISSTFPGDAAVVMAPGEERSFTVELRNDGTSTWTANTALGTSPRDSASALAHESWPSPSRLAHPSGDVAPGGTGSFTFTVRAPEIEGTTVQSLALVEEWVTWFGDIPWGGGPADDFLVLTLTVEEPAPGEEGGDVGAGEGGGGDVGDDGGDGGGGLAEVGAGDPPGELTPLSEVGKGGCATAPAGGLGGLLGALALLGRRRRR